MFIPNDIWRYIVELGGPIVKYKLSCCCSHLRTILLSLCHYEFEANAILYKLEDVQVVLSKKVMELFWKRWDTYTSNKNKKMVHTEKTPSLVYCYQGFGRKRQIQGSSLQRVIDRYDRIILDKITPIYNFEVPNRNRAFEESLRFRALLDTRHLLTFALFEYFDTKITLNLAKNPKVGKRKASKRKDELDIITQELRYHIIIHLDEVNSSLFDMKAQQHYAQSYLNPTLSHQYYNQWQTFSPTKKEPHYAEYMISTIRHFLESVSIPQSFCTYRCDPERNLIHFIFRPDLDFD
jgi:hypothetical protein